MKHEIIILHPDNQLPDNEWLRNPDQIPANVFLIFDGKLMNARILYAQMGKILSE